MKTRYQIHLEEMRAEQRINQCFTPAMRPSSFQFRGLGAPVCSTFGCPKRLTLAEQLAGSKCTGCMNTKPINITNTIKHP